MQPDRLNPLGVAPGSHFRAVTEASPDATLVHDGVSILYVNPAAVRYLGYAAVTELVGHPLAAISPSEELAPKEGEPPRLARFVRKDGTFVSAEVLNVPLLFDGVQASLTIARDVTKRLELETRQLLSDRMVSLGTLATGVSHEINNPLAYVLSNLGFALDELEQMIADLPADDDFARRLRETASALADARDGAERVRTIVRNLRAVPGEGEGRSPIDLRQVLEHAVSLSVDQVRPRARLDADLGEVPLVLAHEDKLGQVFLNLIANALQSIPEGDPAGNRIHVVCREENGRALVEISDTGEGIAERVLPRIFDPFFTTRAVGRGTGLGLFICHNLVTYFGGEISAESVEGVGTTLRVSFPGVAPVVAPARVSEQAAPRRGRILVIDDEPLIGHALRRALKNEHDVVPVISGALALAQLAAGERYDVVFCDLMMPEMTGMEFHAVVQREYPTELAKIVFFTGGAYSPPAVAFLNGVDNARVEKPADMAALRLLIRSRLA